jgi:MFS family permease
MVRGPSRIERWGIFYGWLVVAAAFAVTFVGFGSAYTFSAFLASLEQDFAASRGSVSLVFSLAGFLYFGLGSVSGPLADRFGSRRLVVAGMLLTGAPQAPPRLYSRSMLLTDLALASGWAAPMFRLSARCSDGSYAGADLRPGLR